MIKTDNYNIYILETGRFAMDAGSVFGTIPKVLWKDKVKTDRENRYTLALRSILIIGHEKKILVETGIDQSINPKLREIYKVDKSEYSLQTALAEHNIGLNEITDVINTHLHFDHSGNNTISKDGKIMPKFPKARYHIQKEQFDWAKSPTDLDGTSFNKDYFMPLMENGVLNIIDGEVELFDDIKLFITRGHSPGQQQILIQDKESPVFICGDLFPTHYHIKTPWITSFDLFPVEQLNEKKKFHNMVLKNNWKIIFPHDPDIKIAKLSGGDKFPKVNKIINTG